MGAPVPEMEAAGDATAEALLSSLKTIAAGERRKHATVFNYWQSIRGNRQFPPIRDLDPLEISDAGPWSILLEMNGGGEDAVVRHFGQAIRLGLDVNKIGEAPNPSLLASIHNKLPIVAACRQAFAFEEAFETDSGEARCWVTLLPFSETGTWIDYVYGFVSLAEPGAAEQAAAPVEEADAPVDEQPGAIEETIEAAVEEIAADEEPVETVEEQPEAIEETEEAVADELPEAIDEPIDVREEALEPFQVPLGRLDGEAMDEEEPVESLELTEETVEAVVEPEPEPELEPEAQPAEAELKSIAEVESKGHEGFEPEVQPEFEAEPESEPEPELESASKPSFSSKLLDSIASFSGFHGRVVQSGPIGPEGAGEDQEAPAEQPEYAVEPEFVGQEPEATADVPVAPANSIEEGALQSKLSEVRAKAEEARLAQLACDQALCEGLGAAYDFALDAEQQPEEYLRLVEAQGLKIQLRSPMKPVARLAFDGTCDDASIVQLEAILAWAFKHDLPRGSLPERIEAEGGIGQILGSQARSA